MADTLTNQTDKIEMPDSQTDPRTDPHTLQTPGWLNKIVAAIAEGVLMMVTIGIITAMWLPAYLTSLGQTSAHAEHSHEDPFGAMPHSR